MRGEISKAFLTELQMQFSNLCPSPNANVHLHYDKWIIYMYTCTCTCIYTCTCMDVYVHVHVEWMDEMGNMGTVHGCTCTMYM